MVPPTGNSRSPHFLGNPVRNVCVPRTRTTSQNDGEEATSESSGLVAGPPHQSPVFHPLNPSTEQTLPAPDCPQPLREQSVNGPHFHLAGQEAGASGQTSHRGGIPLGHSGRHPALPLHLEPCTRHHGSIPDSAVVSWVTLGKVLDSSGSVSRVTFLICEMAPRGSKCLCLTGRKVRFKGFRCLARGPVGSEGAETTGLGAMAQEPVFSTRGPTALGDSSPREPTDPEGHWAPTGPRSAGPRFIPQVTCFHCSG